MTEQPKAPSLDAQIFQAVESALTSAARVAGVAVATSWLETRARNSRMEMQALLGRLGIDHATSDPVEAENAALRAENLELRKALEMADKWAIASGGHPTGPAAKQPKS